MKAASRSEHARTLAVAASNLWVDAATVRVINGLVAADVPCVVLKGPSTARWFYPPNEPRMYGDVDVLVRERTLPEAMGHLRTLGYRDRFDSVIERGATSHARTLDHPEGLPAVDLHTSLVGARAAAERVWEAFIKHRTDMPLAGGRIPILDLEACAAVVALHASATGVDSPKVRRDLSRATEAVNEEQWAAARSIAHAIDALPSFDLALRSNPEGRELCRRLGWNAPIDDPDAVLLAAGDQDLTLGLRRLKRTRGWRNRVALLRRELMPSRQFMWKWARRRSSGVHLACDYVTRLVWIARRLPSALVRVRRAERQASSATDLSSNAGRAPRDTKGGDVAS